MASRILFFMCTSFFMWSAANFGFMGAGIALIIIIVLLVVGIAAYKRWREREKIKWYARVVWPIVERSRHPEDVYVCERAAEHRKYLKLSGNKLFSEHGLAVATSIFRDGRPNETWEEYHDPEGRADQDEKGLREIWDKKLRSLVQSKKLSEDWYVRNILKQTTGTSAVNDPETKSAPRILQWLGIAK